MPSLGCVITAYIPFILDEDSYYFYIGIKLKKGTYANLAIRKDFIISKIRVPTSQLKYLKFQKFLLKGEVCHFLKRTNLSANIKFYNNSCIYEPDNKTTIFLTKENLLIEKEKLKLEIPQKEILLKVYKN